MSKFNNSFLIENMLVALIKSSGSLFQRVRASRKKECLYSEVFAHGIVTELTFIVVLPYGTLLVVIGASGNSINFLIILNK